MKKVIGILLFLLLLGGAGWTGFHMDEIWPVVCDWLSDSERNPAIHVHEAGEVPADVRQDVERAASKFPLLIEHEMGIGLLHSVNIYIAATANDYEGVLKEHFDLSPADAREVAAVSGGWSGGRIHTTAINGTAGVMNSSSERVATTGHELFHQVQYELSHGNDADETALFWLGEGSADYVGAMLAEKVSGRPLEKWHMDVLDDLLGAAQSIRPENLQHLDFSQRKSVMAKENHAYQTADLMTWYLLQRYSREEANQRLTAYFHMLAEQKKGEEAFAEAFGMSHDDFLQEYDAWFQQQKAQPAVFHYEVRDGVSKAAAGAIKNEVEASQSFLTRHFGHALGGEYTLVLTKSGEDLVAAAQASGMTKEEASAFAGDSLWVEKGSTVILNVSRLNDERQRIFNLGVMVTRIMQAQHFGSEGQELVWLTRGMAYLVGVGRLTESGYGTLPDYRRAWLQTLQQNGRLPELSSLATKKGFEESSSALGSSAVSAYAELAAANLLERRGWSGFYRWLRAAGINGSQDESLQASLKAFQQVYGMSSENFAASLRVQLSREMYTQ